MVSLELMRTSNSMIATSLPAGLVAVFVGATSGIGEGTLKQFARNTTQPRIYFLGRREHEGKRIEAELKQLNPAGEYNFIQADLSLLKNVDDACRYIRSRESAINLLFLTCGSLPTGKQTTEGLHYPMALIYYARTRFIVNLLPQLKQAKSLRRVITVAAAGQEGPINTSDWQANHMDIPSYRSHVTSMITLTLLAIARKAPSVSFVHNYPGTVDTAITRRLTASVSSVTAVQPAPAKAMLKIPIDEAGERQLYFATSARFPPIVIDAGAESTSGGGADEMVTLGEGVGTALGADGTPGGGVYSVDYEAEGTSERVQGVLGGFENDGTAEMVWKHVQDEFVRVTGSTAI